MPDESAQIPTPDEIVGKGIDKLVELRPRALRHINYGRGVYANVFAGCRAQAALVIRRLADLAKNGRIAFGEGDPLKALAESEFASLEDEGPISAVGQVVMTRSGALPGGSIRRGARFQRPADSSSQRLYGEAMYQCAVDTQVRQGETSITVPLVAARAGAHANRPYLGVAQTELEIADDIVDRAAWTISSYEMGGGSDGVSDDDRKRYARAFAIGRHGPTDKAALAGALRAGAKHVIAIDDPSVAALRLYIGDSSWAGSTRWASLVRQRLSDDKAVGFGCKILLSFVTNEIVAVEATCRLRSSAFLSETSSIDVAVQKAIRAYFDDRPDWNRWKSTALRGVIARSDRRILSCSSVTVKTLAGAAVPEPTSDSAKHFMLLDNSVRATYQSPN